MWIFHLYDISIWINWTSQDHNSHIRLVASILDSPKLKAIEYLSYNSHDMNILKLILLYFILQAVKYLDFFSGFLLFFLVFSMCAKVKQMSYYSKCILYLHYFFINLKVFGVLTVHRYNKNLINRAFSSTYFRTYLSV